MDDPLLCTTKYDEKELWPQFLGERNAERRGKTLRQGSLASSLENIVSLLSLRRNRTLWFKLVFVGLIVVLLTIYRNPTTRIPNSSSARVHPSGRTDKMVRTRRNFFAAPSKLCVRMSEKDKFPKTEIESIRWNFDWVTCDNGGNQLSASLLCSLPPSPPWRS